MSSNPRLESDKVEHHHKISEPVHDPVCGMIVDPQTDLREVHAGARYLFCGAHCQARFREDLDRYTAAIKLKDPVCGMSVDADSELREVHAEATYAFCSVHCQTKFRENPGQYVGEESPEAGAVVGEVERVAEGAVYICPMDTEIRQDGPGSCPKCGMALEPEIPATPATRTQYACPMHLEIVEVEPGSCPICGMVLEPMTVTVEEEGELVSWCICGTREETRRECSAGVTGRRGQSLPYSHD